LPELQLFKIKTAIMILVAKNF